MARPEVNGCFQGVSRCFQGLFAICSTIFRTRARGGQDAAPVAADPALSELVPASDAPEPASLSKPLAPTEADEPSPEAGEEHAQLINKNPNSSDEGVLAICVSAPGEQDAAPLAADLALSEPTPASDVPAPPSSSHNCVPPSYQSAQAYVKYPDAQPPLSRQATVEENEQWSTTNPSHSDEGGSDMEMDLEISWQEEAKPTTVQSMDATRVGPFRVEVPLGNGGQASVFQGRHSRTGELVALKVAKSPSCSAALKHEQTVLRKLRHPNIISMVEAIDGGATALELCTGGDLLSFAKQNFEDRTLLAEMQLQDTYAQLLAAVQYIHKQSVVHRDIKLENVMLRAQGLLDVVLCDFGCALVGRTEYEEAAGTSGYMSREAAEVWFQRARSYLVREADLWSCGVLWWGLMHGGSLPWGSSNNHGCKLPKLAHSSEPKKALEMLSALLAQEPRERDLERAIRAAEQLRSHLQQRLE